MTPKVWKQFLVNNKTFWIQSAEESHKDQIANAMAYKFTAEEPIGKYSGQDTKKQNNYLKATKEVLDNGNGIVCLTMEGEQPVIAGFLNLEQASTDDDLSVFRVGRRILMYMLSRRNLFAELKINKYMGERGLYVFDAYKGNGIGCELLKCWEIVANENNLTVGFGIFTSKYAQRAAERAGLVKVLHVPFEEVRQAFPDVIPEGIEDDTPGLELFCFKHEILKAVKDMLDQEHSIVCLTMENEQPTIAGFFNLEVVSIGDVCIFERTDFLQYLKDLSVLKPGRGMLMYMLSRRNLCAELNINKYMGERGVYVFDRYKGNGIGCELLKCWVLVAKKNNLPIAFGIFSSKYSQKAAERAGLIKVLHVPYKELREKFPDVIPEGVEDHTPGLELFCSKHKMLTETRYLMDKIVQK